MMNSRLALEATETHRKATAGRIHQLAFTPEQELAAVTGFLASLTHNIIPSSVDPLLSIDPQLVLEFDTRATRVAEAVEEMVHDVWTNNPVVFYSKYHSAGCREIKRQLASFHLQPPPTIIDVDIRGDSKVLTPMLFRLTSLTQLPILLVGGEPVGTLEEIREKVLSGELQQKIQESGAVIGGGKKRGGRKIDM
ncbi:glutathione transferase [Moniliophthora roreri MCA 2997]|uniref:Glutathione transferase n=2 Tax=Moniliophthora roreri TaxID=221103 RepID=V2XEE8_MONRO|nr:glutathione transferase [Moniliophthora roreri MCA 2997]KAI3604545.1 glutathione transferase [Moniliophthora roreri]